MFDNIEKNHYIKKTVVTVFSMLAISSGVFEQSNCVFAGKPGGDKPVSGNTNHASEKVTLPSAHLLVQGAQLFNLNSIGVVSSFQIANTSFVVSTQDHAHDQLGSDMGTPPISSKKLRKSREIIELNQAAQCFKNSVYKILSDNSTGKRSKISKTIIQPIINVVGKELSGPNFVYMDRDHFRSIDSFFRDYAPLANQILGRLMDLNQWKKNKNMTTVELSKSIRTAGWKFWTRQ